MPRPCLLMLLCNFRYCTSFQIQIYPSLPLQPTLLILKEETETGHILEPTGLFRTFWTIQQGHASFSFSTCSETRDTWTRITKTMTRQAGAGSKAVAPLPRSRLADTLHSTQPSADTLGRPPGHCATRVPATAHSPTWAIFIHSIPKRSLIGI